MKHLLAIGLLLCPLMLHAIEISEAKYGFSATAPTDDGWLEPKHEVKPPHGNSASWTIRNNKKNIILYAAIIDSPVPGSDGWSLEKHATEWSKSVKEQSSSIQSQSFVNLGGVKVKQIIGTMQYGGEETHFVRWMHQAGDVTYQVSILSPHPIELDSPAIAAFIKSVKISPGKEGEHVSAGNGG